MYIFRIYQSLYLESTAPSLSCGRLKNSSLFCEHASANAQAVIGKSAVLKENVNESVEVLELQARYL